MCQKVSYILEYSCDDNVQVNQDMIIFLSGSNKDGDLLKRNLTSLKRREGKKENKERKQIV